MVTELTGPELYTMHAVAEHIAHGQEIAAAELLSRHAPDRAELIRAAAHSIID
jgi:hypothetical protein